jgi:hypothetical protein
MALIEACRKNVALEAPPARLFQVSFRSAGESEPRRLTFRQTCCPPDMSAARSRFVTGRGARAVPLAKDADISIAYLARTP